MAHAISEQGVALLKRLEGFRATPMTLSDGRCLVGYGHVQASPSGKTLDEEEAIALLRADIAPVVDALNDLLLAPVTQGQFDALVSFAFSIGVDSFARSDVLRRFNAGEPIAAACAMDAWRKSRVAGEPAVLDALVRRRTAEKAVFLELGDLSPAASAYVRAEIDHAAAILGQPTAVSTIPSDAPPALSDATARKIAQILASDPGTAHVLQAPTSFEALDMDEDGSDLPVPSPRSTDPGPDATDVTGLALFGMAGVGLLAAAMIAQQQNHPVLFLLFAAPGVVMLGGAAWRLLRKAGGARYPETRRRA